EPRVRVQQAEAQLEAARAQARAAEAQAAAELARAQVDAAEAALELACLQLSYTRIVAPVAGVASSLSVHEGQLVQPGQPIAELVPRSTYVVANFKETQIGRMRPGQKATVHV